MQELLTLVLEQLRNTWRFRWVALLIAWAVAIVGWVYVYSLPNTYQASARVHIDTRSAINPLLSGMAVIPDVTQQVDLLIQTVKSQPNLTDIARRTGLDLQADTPDAEQALLLDLRQNISLKNVGGRKIDLYRIAYTSTDAATAQAVVQQVINIMTGMAVGDQGQGSEHATDFLKREVANYRQQLDATERKLAQFKKNNADFMPGNQDYVQRLQGLQADISRLNDNLSSVEQRRSLLRQQLGGSGQSVSPEQSQQVQSIDAQINQRQNQLSQLLTRYTDQHPDVLTAKQDIKRLQDRRQQTIARLRANPGEAKMASGGNNAGLQGQLTDASVTISTLQTSIQRKKSQLSDLKQGADKMTDAQAQLAELNRNYEITRNQYQKLLTRLYSARLSGDVQQNGNPLKFRVVDPPEKPAEASGPQRVILITMVLFGSLAAGVAFAFFLSQIRPVFINRRALTDATGLPVLGSVSLARSRGQIARQKTGLLLFIVCAATLVLGYIAAVMLAPFGVGMVPNLMTGQWL